MGYSINWKVENRLIFVEIFDVLKLSEARDLNNQLRDYVVNGTAPVHLIVEMTQLLHSPTSIQVNRRMTDRYLKHPNMGWVILIGGNRIIDFLIKVLSSLTKFKFKKVKDFDEASTVLQSLDPSLTESCV